MFDDKAFGEGNNCNYMIIITLQDLFFTTGSTSLKKEPQTEFSQSTVLF